MIYDPWQRHDVRISSTVSKLKIDFREKEDGGLKSTVVDSFSDKRDHKYHFPQ